MFAPRLFIVLKPTGMMVAEGIRGMVGLSLGAAMSSACRGLSVRGGAV